MKTSRWFSDAFGRLSRRERRVVAAGGAAAGVLLLLTQVALPAVDRWSEREARIQARAAQLARLEALVAGEDVLRDAVAELESRREAAASRLLEGSTPSLAASALQSLLNGYAQRSGVSVLRVEAEGGEAEPAEDGLTRVPLRLTVRGDVYGLVDLLFYVQSGETLLVIDELSVSGGRPFNRAPETMNWSIRLHGLYIDETEPSGEGA